MDPSYSMQTECTNIISWFIIYHQMLYQMCCFKNQNAWHMSKNWTSPVPPKPRDIFFNHGAQAPQRSSPAQRKPWKAQRFWMAWFKCMKNSYFTWMIDNIAPNQLTTPAFGLSETHGTTSKNIAPEHRARQRSWTINWSIFGCMKVPNEQ